jgi:hypothetical protein
MTREQWFLGCHKHTVMEEIRSKARSYTDKPDLKESMTTHRAHTIYRATSLRQDVTVCNSYNIYGLEAYLAYCQETFSSVLESKLYSTLQFDLAYADFSKTVTRLEADPDLPEEVVIQETEVALTDLEEALATTMDMNPCLQGCAFFILGACCRDELMLG